MVKSYGDDPSIVLKSTYKAAPPTENDVASFYGTFNYRTGEWLKASNRRYLGLIYIAKREMKN